MIGCYPGQRLFAGAPHTFVLCQCYSWRCDVIVVLQSSASSSVRSVARRSCTAPTSWRTCTCTWTRTWQRHRQQHPRTSSSRRTQQLSASSRQRLTQMRPAWKRRINRVRHSRRRRRRYWRTAQIYSWISPQPK